MQAYRGKKEVQRVHQNDQKSLSCKIQGGKKFIQSRDERPKKKRKKKKKPARLKTQKGGLGKSQGQRKEEEEEEEEKNWKILPSWKLEDATLKKNNFRR